MASQEIKTLEIPMMLDNLDHALKELGETTDTLISRLHPALKPRSEDVNAVVPSASPPDDLSPFAISIWEKTLDVERTHDKLKSLWSHLQL